MAVRTSPRMYKELPTHINVTCMLHTFLVPSPNKIAFHVAIAGVLFLSLACWKRLKPYQQAVLLGGKWLISFRDCVINLYIYINITMSILFDIKEYSTYGFVWSIYTYPSGLWLLVCPRVSKRTLVDMDQIDLAKQHKNITHSVGITLDICYKKNIERHTADIIVSWPNPKQWVIVHTSDLMLIIRQSIHILSNITRELGNLKTYSPTYCIMDNGENKLNHTYTLDKIYLTGIL